jgi:DNA repair exonuclease SbcCD ATPase subunit
MFHCLFQAIQESITVLAPLMSNYADTHNDLAKHCSADEVAEAEKELERNKERYQSLRAEIEKRGIQVGMTLQQEEQLQVMLEELISHLEKRREELNNLEPIGIHSDVVREQLHAHEVSVLVFDSFLLHSRMMALTFPVCFLANLGLGKWCQ